MVVLQEKEENEEEMTNEFGIRTGRTTAVTMKKTKTSSLNFELVYSNKRLVLLSVQTGGISIKRLQCFV